MYSAIQTGGAIGMQTMDQCLADLVERRVITRDVAREKAQACRRTFNFGHSTSVLVCASRRRVIGGQRE